MMRLLVLLPILFFSFSRGNTSADERGDYGLAAPDDWRGETIRLPPGFAKDMSLRGVEHVRFAPGMMSANSDSFFCYAFAFDVQPKPALTGAVLQEELLKYYRGLCVAVLKDKSTDTSTFTLQLTPAKANSEVKNSVDAVRYSATLDWIEPFATKERQQLNMEIHTWTSGDRSFAFVCASPQAVDAAIWKELRKVRDDYQSR